MGGRPQGPVAFECASPDRSFTNDSYWPTCVLGAGGQAARYGGVGVRLLRAAYLAVDVGRRAAGPDPKQSS